MDSLWWHSNIALTSNGDPRDLKTRDVQFHHRNLLQALNQWRLQTQSQHLDICIILGNYMRRQSIINQWKHHFDSDPRSWPSCTCTIWFGWKKSFVSYILTVNNSSHLLKKKHSSPSRNSRISFPVPLHSAQHLVRSCGPMQHWALHSAK